MLHNISFFITFLYQIFRFDFYLLTNYSRTVTSMRLFFFACLFCAVTLSMLSFYLPIATLGLNFASLLSGAIGTASVLYVYTCIRATFFYINAFHFNYHLIFDTHHELLNQIETPDQDNIIENKARLIEILDNKINRVDEEEEAFFETYLNDCLLPERLCCPFTHSLMNFPIKGEDNHYYDLLQLSRYYIHRKMPHEKVPYPLNPSLTINPYFLFYITIDRAKYLEIQNYKQSIFYAKLSWPKTIQAALTQGITLSFITCCITLPYFVHFGLLGCALASTVGFLTGVGVYFRTRYSVMALESVRQKKEALKNATPSNDPIPDSDVYHLGKLASKEYKAYFTSWFPSKTSEKTPYTDPEEWYAGFQAGVEEAEAENTIIYSFNP